VQLTSLFDQDHRLQTWGRYRVCKAAIAPSIPGPHRCGATRCGWRRKECTHSVPARRRTVDNGERPAGHVQWSIQGGESRVRDGAGPAGRAGFEIWPVPKHQQVRNSWKLPLSGMLASERDAKDASRLWEGRVGFKSIES
jgi:hypothetical protein